MIFDTHCHLGYDDDSDGSADIERAREAGVSRVIDVGIDLESSRRARARSRAFDGVFHSVGLHPNDSSKLDEQWD